MSSPGIYRWRSRHTIGLGSCAEQVMLSYDSWFECGVFTMWPLTYLEAFGAGWPKSVPYDDIAFVREATEQEMAFASALQLKVGR